jgi:hypothetical protein
MMTLRMYLIMTMRARTMMKMMTMIIVTMMNWTTQSENAENVLKKGCVLRCPQDGRRSLKLTTQWEE